MAGTFRQARPGVSQALAGRGRQRVLRRAAALSGAAAAAALAAACGTSAGTAASSPASPDTGSNGNAAGAHAISARQLSGVGTVLVNSSGLTIYTPKAPVEMSGNIKCTGSCLSFWIPVTAGSAHLAASGLPGVVGTIHRPDGRSQLTYNGRPLYTFRLDTAAGQAHGNNFSDHFNGTAFTWQAVTTSGKTGQTGSQGPSYSQPPGY